MSGWKSLIEASAGPAANLRTALDDPRGTQKRLLASILRDNEASQFGRRFRFAHIRNADDFRAEVPISTYEDLSGLIERSAAGEIGVLTSALIVAFEATGGSASGRKLIPYTRQSLAAFRDSVLPWLANLLARRPGVARGKTYAAISPATRASTYTSGGSPIGLASDAAYLGPDLGVAFADIMAVPPQVGTLSSITQWRRETLRHLIACENLAFVSVWSPTFFLELIDHIPQIASEIAPLLASAERVRLEAALAGGRLNTTILWPRLDTISCWLDAGSSPFARQLAAALPQAHLEPKGLLATEAPITLPWGDARGAVPALTSTFVEFIDRAGRSFLADEIREGESYRIIITTPGGLYRYDLGDQVQCVGFAGPTPRLVFEGRVGLSSDLVGEKLTEAFAARALSSLCIPTALAPSLEGGPHYEIWADAPISAQDIAQVEQALYENPQYAYARHLGQLGALTQRTQLGFRATLAEDALKEGRRLGDIKATTLLTQAQRCALNAVSR